MWKTRFSPGSRRSSTPCRRGFTLVELLAVVAIVGILLGILFPVLSHARAEADEAVCAGRFRQIGTLITVYMADHHGMFPGPLADSRVCGWYAKNTAYEQGTLAGRLQPYIGAAAPFNANRQYPEIFKCPTVEKNPRPSKAVSNDGDIITKLVNIAVPLDPATGSDTVNPWGVGNDSTLAAGASGAASPLRYAALGNCPLARTFAVRECSSANTTVTPVNTVVPHGKTLNALFLDWHVGRLDASTLNPL